MCCVLCVLRREITFLWLTYSFPGTQCDILHNKLASGRAQVTGRQCTFAIFFSLTRSVVSRRWVNSEKKQGDFGPVICIALYNGKWQDNGKRPSFKDWVRDPPAQIVDSLLVEPFVKTKLPSAWAADCINEQWLTIKGESARHDSVLLKVITCITLKYKIS